MAVTHEHAVEVDTRLAALWEAQQEAHRAVGQAVQSLHGSLGHKYQWVAKGTSPYRETMANTLAEARRVIAEPVEGPHFWRSSQGELRPQSSAGYITRALAQYDAAVAAMAQARADAAPLEAEYRAEQWSRFFLVTNTGGHIHSSMDCSTTFPTTDWAWLPQLSGLTEDAAVAEQGPRLCSICFPGAPVEWTLGLPAKVNPNRCPGSGEQAVDVSYRYRSPRGRCAVCGTGVSTSSTGKARPHNTPKGA